MVADTPPRRTVLGKELNGPTLGLALDWPHSAPGRRRQTRGELGARWI